MLIWRPRRILVGLTQLAQNAGGGEASTGRRKYPDHLEFEFSPLKRTFPIRQGLIVALRVRYSL